MANCSFHGIYSFTSMLQIVQSCAIRCNTCYVLIGIHRCVRKAKEKPCNGTFAMLYVFYMNICKHERQ